MVSTYGYTTLVALELFAVEDYSARSATFTDTVIEAIITQAERLINVYCHTTFTGTIPDGVVAVVLELAFRLMYNRMLFAGAVDRDNFPAEKEIIIKNDAGLMDLLNEHVRGDETNYPLIDTFNTAEDPVDWNYGL